MSPHDQSHLLRPPPTRGPIAPFYIVFFSYIYIAVKQACRVLTGDPPSLIHATHVLQMCIHWFSHECKDFKWFCSRTKLLSLCCSDFFFKWTTKWALIGQPQDAQSGVKGCLPKLDATNAFTMPDLLGGWWDLYKRIENSRNWAVEGFAKMKRKSKKISVVRQLGIPLLHAAKTNRSRQRLNPRGDISWSV